KTHLAGAHNQNINDDDANRLANAERTINSLKEQIEKYKISKDELENKLLELNKKLSDVDDEQHANIQTFEKLIAQAEKTIANLKNKIDKMQKEHSQDIRNKVDKMQKEHQNIIGMFNKQKDEEIAQVTRTMEMRLESFMKRQKDVAAGDKDGSNSKRVIILEQEISQLENSLKYSQTECTRLNESLKQVQMKYLNAVSDKDQSTNAKREVEKKIKAIETELRMVKEESRRKDSQLQE
ncbi:9778_t:CDS:2, partial [Scutellospora calospora]